MATLPIPEAPAHGSAITANWGRKVVECLRRLAPVAGQGMRLVFTPNGTVYNSQPGEAAGSQDAELKPFDIRWYSYGDDADDGEWQIYLPLGCVSISQMLPGMESLPCVCVNGEAEDENGASIYGWYRIEDPDESEGQVMWTGGKVYHTIPVYALVKPWPRFMVSANRDSYDTVQGSVVVGNMCIAKGSGDEDTIRMGQRVVSEPFCVDNGREFSTFNICYQFDDGALYSKDAEPKVMITDLLLVAGRTVVADSHEVDISGWEEVWLKLEHDVTDAADMKISVVKAREMPNDTTSYMLLYRLADDIVTGDYRHNVKDIRFYDS